VLFSWIVTRCRPLLRTLHVASLVYAIVIELVPWPPCPLTVAETWLETRAGIEPAHGPFLVRFLDAVIYPDLPEWLVVGCVVFVCVAILSVYLRRYLCRSAANCRPDFFFAMRAQPWALSSYTLEIFLGWNYLELKVKGPLLLNGPLAAVEEEPGRENRCRQCDSKNLVTAGSL
jgi:uncharacterized protein DUF2784